MFRSHRKLTSLFICMFILVSILSPVTIQAKGLIVESDKPEVAIVIDVIDGEAIKVMHLHSTASTPIIEMIRLIGVDSMANDETYEYMKDQLLGQPVFILYDENVLPVTDEYVNAYVFANTDQTLNETLLTYGYAVLDETYSNATYYKDLVDAEFYAVRQEKGLHKLSTTPSNIININLASSSIIEEHLDVSSEVASRIVSYRNRNPINDSKELGFIHDELDREFIIENRASIHYTTNINDATLYELTSLFATSNGLNMAHDVNRDRVFTPFVYVEDLKSITSVSSYYTIIEPYITTTINDNILVNEDYQVANVNTASVSELVEASGMSTYNAEKIVDQRDDIGYIYRSLEELSKSNFPLANIDLAPYIDNLSFATEINKAEDFELETLFSNFELSDEIQESMVEKINYSKPFYSYKEVSDVIGSAFYEELQSLIYIEGIDNKAVAPMNVNSADEEDLVDHLDLTGSDETSVLDRNYDYTNPSQLTFVDLDDMELITLFTNVNNASYNELMNMSDHMTATIANEIIDYRSYYPIYTTEELKSILSDLSKLYVYELIKNEVVFY